MTPLNVAGQVGGFVVEQPASAGFAVVTHVAAEHVIKVSHPARGSLPYSQVSATVQGLPDAGIELGHAAFWGARHYCCRHYCCSRTHRLHHVRWN